MLLSSFLNILIIIYKITQTQSSSYTYDVLKPKFEENFHSSCSKYDFFHTHYDRLTKNDTKYVGINFKGNGNDGGLGDRIAQLITAAGLAIRFNRRLIFRHSLGFDQLFRPYIPFKVLNHDPNVTKKLSYSHNSIGLTSFKYNRVNDSDIYKLICYNIELEKHKSLLANKTYDKDL